MKKLFLAALLFSVSALAQTPRQAVITYQRPTAYTDGSVLDASVAVSYGVYQGAKGSAKTKIGTITSIQTTITTGLQPGETCWEVTAIANGIEGILRLA